MTPERVEEELFGIEDSNGLVRPGLLEQGHGGTLYLDEIADMPLTTQGKILRVLTDQSFTRVGGQRLVKRSEEHTSELQSLMRISYAVFCLKKKKKKEHR